MFRLPGRSNQFFFMTFSPNALWLSDYLVVKNIAGIKLASITILFIFTINNVKVQLSKKTIE